MVRANLCRKVDLEGQSHKLIKVFRITRKLQSGEFDQAPSPAL